MSDRPPFDEGEPNDAPPSTEPEGDDAGLAKVLPFLAPALEPLSDFPQPGELGTTLITPDDPEAPPLLLTTEEPPPRPSRGAEVLESPETLATLRKLAGPPAPSRDDREAALRAALQGRAYHAAHLPSAQAMVLGLARAALEAGLELERVVELMLAASQE